MNKYMQLIRIKHWIKNLLIFVPMFFAKSINFQNIFTTIIGFLAFSLATSFVYIINDLKDIEKDKLHPRKKERPLPSGKVSKDKAKIISIIILISAITINAFVSKSSNSFYILLAYIILNIAYSIKLKDIAIVDIAILASGFVLRVYYGAELLNIIVSDWLFLTILSAALFLGLGKRKKELIKHIESRKVLKKYNETFLDKFQNIFISLTLVFYSLWAMEQDIQFMVFTIPLVILIFMRYSLIIETEEEGDPTTILYSDIFLMSLCIIYSILMCVLIIL